ncbi:MAG: PQQ-binding-like beta-propeller repeat protein, partial [Bryobacteraceae bacterium]
MYRLPTVLFLSLLVLLPARADWLDWRGPARDGVSPEKNLPTQWSPSGQNLAWKAPYGGRSTPIVVGDHVYLQNTSGKGVTLRERLMCFHADTGKVLWEHSFNVFMSDVPTHRVGWASPVGDSTTGNVYVFGGGGSLLAFSSAGKVLWERSLGEDFGLVTTHGGRTVSPIIEEDLVIVSGVTTAWGAYARAGHRFMAFNKKTGETMWVSSPGGRPYDTTYAPPIAATINGVRLLIQGGGDGTVHAIKAQTGEPVWRYEVSKRGINTGVVLNGNTAYVSHSEENLAGSEMGLLAAIDASAKGTIGPDKVKWTLKGFQGGYSSPFIDGDRILQVDNGANLFAFDIVTGKELWKQNLGTIQKASPVYADGKIYVGTENGKFFILKPHSDKCEILDTDVLGAEGAPEAILASVAISGGRVYLASMDALYAIGKKAKDIPSKAPEKQIAPAGAAVAHVQIVPTELLLKPGQKVHLRARLFDAQGRFIKEGSAAWSLDKLKGTIENGDFTPSSESVSQAGLVKATVDGVTGAAPMRVIAPLPWSEDFESAAVGSVPPWWVNSTGKFVVRDVEGKKFLAKLADNPFTKRAKAYMGPVDWANYTVQCDVSAAEKRRQMGDGGVIAQRYALILFGNHQRLELQPWQPETARTVTVPFPWKANTWYRMKLRVENQTDGKTLARGKVWLASEAEPAAWMIERADPIPNKQGAPG